MGLFDSEKIKLVSKALARVESELEFHEEDGELCIITPHYDLDGDYIEFFLREEMFEYKFTDFGLTLMRLSSKQTEIDPRSRTRYEIFTNILKNYSVDFVNGRLEKVVPKDSDIGIAYLEYLIALGKIYDLAFTRRDYIRSMFIEEVFMLLSTHSPDKFAIERNWKDEKDKRGEYPIDFKIANGRRPVYCFAVNSVRRASEAHLFLMYHRFEFGSDFISMSFFDEDLDLNDKKLHGFSNWVDKDFIGIEGNVGEQYANWVDRFS